MTRVALQVPQYLLLAREPMLAVPIAPRPVTTVLTSTGPDMRRRDVCGERIARRERLVTPFPTACVPILRAVMGRPGGVVGFGLRGRSRVGSSGTRGALGTATHGL